MSVRRRKWKDRTGTVVREAWEVSIVHVAVDGEKRRIRELSPSNTRLDAEKWERQIRKALVDGTYRRGATAAVEVPTVAEFAERFIEWSEVHNKPSSVYAKRCALKEHLLPAFGRIRLNALSPLAIESFKAEKRRAGLKAKTLRNQLAVLSKLLNLAVELGLVMQVPRVRGIRVEEPDFEFLDFDEADRLVDAARHEWRAFIITGLRTGLRVGELLALRWDDVDLKARRITVRRTLWNGQEGSPKGGRARRVDLGEQVSAALAANRHLRGPYVFCRRDGRRLSHSEVKDVVPDACRRAGLAKRMTTHGLRHTFASHLIMRGVTLVAVKELLGHAHISTTMRYAHLAPSATRDAVRLLDSRVEPAWNQSGPEAETVER